MTEKELVVDIIDELTFSNALPFSLPEKEVKRVIKIAANFFFENWRHSVEQKYLVLPVEMFKTEQFSKHRLIQLPECIKFVFDFKEIKGVSIFATIDRDFSEQKFIGSEIFLTPFMGESIMYRTAVFSFLDLTKNFVLDTVSYDFNKNTKQLSVIGHTPKVDCVASVYKKIELESLYEDELYQRYVRAKAKVRLGDMLQTFDFSMPGGVKLNYNVIVTNAEKEMEKIEEQLKSENTPDFVILDRY
jgi:hypothetical protein